MEFTLYKYIWNKNEIKTTSLIPVADRDPCTCKWMIYIYIYIYKRIWIETKHYDDVIMTTMAAQITSLTVVYSTVYSDANQRKHQSSASLAFVWGIHRERWIPRTKGQLRGKCFHLMTSSWHLVKLLGQVRGDHQFSSVRTLPLYNY